MTRATYHDPIVCGKYRPSAVACLNAGPPPEWGPGPHYGWALGVVKASLPPATQEALQRFLDRGAD